MTWQNTSNLPEKRFICGHCGADINSNLGYYYGDYGDNYSAFAYAYICHNCNKISYISYKEQVPGAIYGKSFNKNIFNDTSIFDLYNEARNCMKIGAYTSIGMCCRKILMHIAVDCGAEKGKNFVYYVDYLNQNNYIPSNCKKWVDIIRNKGNEANHEIIILEERDAVQLIQFIQIIISIIYEMPYQANQYIGDIRE